MFLLKGNNPQGTFLNGYGFDPREIEKSNVRDLRDSGIISSYPLSE